MRKEVRRMTMPWTDSQICPNQPYGEHITVRCGGCGSHHSTKNIGWWKEETKVASLARTVFDILGETCSCKDPNEHQLVHDCGVDDTWKRRWSRMKCPHCSSELWEIRVTSPILLLRNESNGWKRTRSVTGLDEYRCPECSKCLNPAEEPMLSILTAEIAAELPLLVGPPSHLGAVLKNMFTEVAKAQRKSDIEWYQRKRGEENADGTD